MPDEQFDMMGEEDLALLSRRFERMYTNWKNARRSSGMCYRCGKHGHFIAECPEAMEVKPEHKHRPRNYHKHRLGLKTIGNGRENTLTIPATIFFSRERERERESRTGKRNRYYGISGTEPFDREHVDYGRKQININGNTNTCYHLKMLTRCNNYSYAYITRQQIHK
jgi:hypothetical protein